MAEDTLPPEPTLMPPVAMHDRYGPFLRSFFAHYFQPIQLPAESIERIQAAARRGPVVYLARSANLVHFLYLNHACLQLDLPLARFVHGLDTVLVQPVDLLLERMRIFGERGDLEPEQGQAPAARQLEATLRAGDASLLYLGQPTTLVHPDHDGHDALLDVLVRVQRTLDRPIQLVPHVILWDVHPERVERGLADVVFGQAEAPGLLRSLLLMMRRYREASVKVAEPLDLQAFLEARREQRAVDQVAELESNLQQSLSLEVFDATGPRIRPHSEYLDEILADPAIADFITAQAGADDTRREELRKRAHDLLDEIAAEPRIRWPLGLNTFLNILWRRMYEGFVVDEAGFETIRAAVRRAPVVFCPSHKSHVDYLVLSQLCLRYRVPLPHIAAGVNLSFWPLGPIFRHSGAFFLRRSFKGDELYPIVFRTYLRHVMTEGFPIEFFIEGGRSRTGKLLNPRFGILGWLVQAYLEGRSDDVLFVPISIDYEKIIEGRSYLHELSGGEKEKEDVTGLLKTSKVLKSKWGKIYVQVSQPISLREFLAERGVEGKRPLDEQERHRLVPSLGYHIQFDISRVATVTPSALVAFVLLGNRRRGMTHDSLLERCRWALEWIQQRGGRLSATLASFERAIGEAVARFSHDGTLSIQDTGAQLVYSVVERRRLALDYYRNNLIQHFVPTGVLALALESHSVEAVPLTSLRERVVELSRLFKREFLFRSERHLDSVMQRALVDLAAEGALREEDGFVVRPAESAERRRQFASVTEHYAEAYWLACRALELLRAGPLAEREFLSRTLQLGDRLFAEGELLLQECLSRDTLKNAVLLWQERGALVEVSESGRRGKALRLGPEFEAEGALESMAAEIRKYLPR